MSAVSFRAEVLDDLYGHASKICATVAELCAGCVDPVAEGGFVVRVSPGLYSAFMPEGGYSPASVLRARVFLDEERARAFAKQIGGWFGKRGEAVPLIEALQDEHAAVFGLIYKWRAR